MKTGQGFFAPPGLVDVLRCGCKVGSKTCSYATCSCYKNKISCIVYCLCGGVDGCYNLFLLKSDEIDDTEGTGTSISDIDDK